MIRDVVFADVKQDRWPDQVRPFVSVMTEPCASDSRSEHPHVVDAKSLFGAISRDAAGNRADRRTAIEM